MFRLVLDDLFFSVTDIFFPFFYHLATLIFWHPLLSAA